MRLMRRIVADVRGPDESDQTVEHIVNEALVALQTNENGHRNPNIEIFNIFEVNKDSGINVFIVIYEDKGLDVKPQ